LSNEKYQYIGVFNKKDFKEKQKGKENDDIFFQFFKKNGINFAYSCIIKNPL